MALTEQDRIDITDLVHLHGHLMDAGRLDELDEMFTPDVIYDLSDYGLGALHGHAAVRQAALALGDANPIGHHVTNILVTELGAGSARVRSKGIGIRADGTSGSVVYDDVVARRPDGWKIHRRTVTARRAALSNRGNTPRDVLERWRRACLDRSADDLRQLYAANAVHEFPFAYPGMPSRLQGRNDIVNWIAGGWAADVPSFERYRTTAVHATGDPDTLVVEQEACGASAAAGEFALPNIIVFTVRHGQIVHLRDYVDVRAAARAMGHDISAPTA